MDFYSRKTLRSLRLCERSKKKEGKADYLFFLTFDPKNGCVVSLHWGDYTPIRLELAEKN
jgi:hypothetical protein